MIRPLRLRPALFASNADGVKSAMQALWASHTRPPSPRPAAEGQRTDIRDWGGQSNPWLRRSQPRPGPERRESSFGMEPAREAAVAPDGSPERPRDHPARAAREPSRESLRRQVLARFRQRAASPDPRRRDLGYIDDEQENLREIDLSGAVQDPGRGVDQPPTPDHRTIDIGVGLTGNENEDLGRIAESIIANPDPADDVRRDVVEEDQQQRQSPE